jgi:5-methylcytosine-specific restriction endonuclease McrA
VGVSRGPTKKPRSGASYRLRQIYERRKHTLLAAYGVLTCHLCGDLINLDLPSRHDLSLSWDHVLPVSTHPHLEESPNNLAPAHFACNRVRQDTPLEEITGTPERIEAFKKLVAANRERTQARKDLKAANQELVVMTRDVVNGVAPANR